MTSGTVWKAYNNRNYPRQNHSVFGDFPDKYIKKKYKGVTTIQPIDKA